MNILQINESLFSTQNQSLGTTCNIMLLQEEGTLQTLVYGSVTSDSTPGLIHYE